MRMTNMNKIIAGGLVLLIGGIVALSQRAAPSDEYEGGGYGVMSVLVPIIDCGSFRVSAFEHDPGEIGIRIVERVPPGFATAAGLSFAPGVTAGAHRASYRFSTSFSLECFAPRSGNEIYIAGHPTLKGGVIDKSQTVIEHWVIDAPMGAPWSFRVESTDPIGTPTPHSDLQVAVVGGEYRMPSQRVAPLVKRTTVARVSYPIYQMKADPDGRYLLILPEGDRVEFLDLLSGTPAPQVLLDSSSAPELTDAGMFLFGIYGADGTKRAVAYGPNGGIVFVDADNDAVFESMQSITHADFNGDYGESSNWQDNFYRYAVSLY